MYRVCLLALVILSVSGEENNTQLSQESQEDEFCAFECKTSMIGDGNCDQACRFSSACKNDGDDCGECSSGCSYYSVGNDSCTPSCYVEDCDWDLGDCDRMPRGERYSVDFLETSSWGYGEGEFWCEWFRCADYMVSDGHCDAECYTENCEFDGGDCEDQKDSETKGFCSPFCKDRWIGDNFCDAACYNEACNWDCGDCNVQKKEERGNEPECKFEEPNESTEYWQKGQCAAGCGIGDPMWDMRGDGYCDSACYNEACDWDTKGEIADCDEKYGEDRTVDRSRCAIGCLNSQVGDGVCDLDCMRAESCENDKGDCDGTYCAFNCLHTMVGNGTCNKECQFSAECDFDGGDCPGNCSPWCTNNAVGNIVECNPACLTEECNWDGGDCDRKPGGKVGLFTGRDDYEWSGWGYRSYGTSGNCAWNACAEKMRGDGFCDPSCNNEGCEYDKGDCIDAKGQPKTQCSEYCEERFVGDGWCDPACNNRDCNYDGGDCDCAPGCRNHWEGDGECDTLCFNDACNKDSGDCECAPGCRWKWLGDGECDTKCRNDACSNDKGDCDECAPGCPKTWINDNICDTKCKNEACEWDGQDCGCAPGCPWSWLGDKYCDAACLGHENCENDRGDCDKKESFLEISEARD